MHSSYKYTKKSGKKYVAQQGPTPFFIFLIAHPVRHHNHGHGHGCSDSTTNNHNCNQT